MDPHATWIADLPPDARRPEDERVLVIAFDASSRGWLLFVCRTGLSDVKWDSWFETFEGAVRQAEKSGVHRDDWRESSAPPAE